MKILFLHGGSIHGGGGVARVTRALVTELERKGHACFFLGIRPGSRRSQFRITGEFLLPHPKPDTRANKKYLAKILSQYQFDAVINQSALDLGWLGLLRPFCSTNKIISVHHNCLGCLQSQYEEIIVSSLLKRGLPEKMIPKALVSMLSRRSRRRIGEIIDEITNRHFRFCLLAEEFKEEVGVFTENANLESIVSIGNPAPFMGDTVAVKEKENRLLYVGRLERGQKRVDRILGLWGRIQMDFPAWSLDIVGEGSHREGLERMVVEKGLERVIFHGQQDPVPYYRKSRLFLMTSNFEGFGMTLVEAQAFGCLPVAFRCFSSIDSVIDDHQTGWIVPHRDEKAFERVVRDAMENTEALVPMMYQAIGHVASFSPEQIATRWLNLISSGVPEEVKNNNINPVVGLR